MEYNIVKLFDRAPTEQATVLQNCPEEIILSALKELFPKDLLAIAIASKILRRIAMDAGLWNRFLLEPSDEQNPNSENHPANLYKDPFKVKIQYLRKHPTIIKIYEELQALSQEEQIEKARQNAETALVLINCDEIYRAKTEDKPRSLASIASSHEKVSEWVLNNAEIYSKLMSRHAIDIHDILDANHWETALHLLQKPQFWGPIQEEYNQALRNLTPDSLGIQNPISRITSKIGLLDFPPMTNTLEDNRALIIQALQREIEKNSATEIEFPTVVSRR